jgi:hypothetical protein
MKKRTKSSVIDRDRKAITGVKLHYASTRSIVLDGVAHATAEIVKIFQDQIDSSDAADAAARTFHQAVAAQEAANAKANAVWLALKTRVLCDFKTSSEILGDFGIALPTRRKPDAAKMAAAVAKRRAKREAQKAAAGSQPATPAANPQAK